MKVAYDKYYETKNYFGDPYPELVKFFVDYPLKGSVLDLGCGQGRNAIALARLGYEVTGIDISKVGVEQMNRVALSEKLHIDGLVADIYAFNRFCEFDIVLIDSMFHFAKKDRKKEVGLIKSVVSNLNEGSLLVNCIQDSGDKVETLNEAIDFEKKRQRLVDVNFQFRFEDVGSGWTTETSYRLIVIKV